MAALRPEYQGCLYYAVPERRGRNSRHVNQFRPHPDLPKKIPQFATQNCTPFLHRHLYKDSMPQCVLQAFSLCVLYTNRTSENRGMVLRVLHESVRGLIHSAVGSSLTPLERIARVHALMMYQYIRMFDGDVTLSTQADGELGLLRSWLAELAKVGDNLDDEAEMDPAAIRGTPPESWEVS